MSIGFRQVSGLFEAFAAGLCLVGGLFAGIVAEAAEIGTPKYQLYVWGIRPTAPTHPLLSGETPLAVATEADAVAGQVLLIEPIGTNSGGSPAEVHAGVDDDGDTFYVFADSPSHYQVASPEFIGGAAEVLIYQSFRKDSPDARLTYTYTFANVASFVDPESSGLCPLGDGGYCLRAEIVSRVVVLRGNGSDAGAEVWSRGDGALVTSRPTAPSLAGFSVGDWPWVVDGNPVPGTVSVEVDLPNVQTQVIDLSGIGVGEEFTVWYQLYAYAYDRANLYDVAVNWRGRNAAAFAKDPLGGDTGVRFDVLDLTPTNDPIEPVPEPSTGAAWTSGVALVLAMARRRALPGRHGRRAPRGDDGRRTTQAA